MRIAVTGTTRLSAQLSRLAVGFGLAIAALVGAVIVLPIKKVR